MPMSYSVGEVMGDRRLALGNQCCSRDSAQKAVELKQVEED